MAEQSELKEFFQEHGKKLIVVLVVILLGVVGIKQYFDASEAKENSENASLGKAMTFVYSGEDASALAEFEKIMPELSGISLAKAALLAGNIQFRQGNFEKALDLFDKSIANAGSATLIEAAAMHGKASALIEKKDYNNAISALESFIRKFGNRTGNLKDRYSKEEPVDEAPNVYDAMWKLALVYKEAGKTDLAKATAEKLLKIYSDKQEIESKAKKFLETL